MLVIQILAFFAEIFAELYCDKQWKTRMGIERKSSARFWLFVAIKFCENFRENCWNLNKNYPTNRATLPLSNPTINKTQFFLNANAFHENFYEWNEANGKTTLPTSKSFKKRKSSFENMLIEALVRGLVLDVINWNKLDVGCLGFVGGGVEFGGFERHLQDSLLKIIFHEEHS